VPELWQYRELLYFFVWRDVKVRYKQTVLGAAWAVLQPAATAAIFTAVFGHLAGLSRQVPGPYALYVFAGLLPWTFFANAVTQAGGSLVGSGHLISKVYFPRLLVPAAAVAAGLVDLAVSLLVLGGLLPLYGVAPTLGLLAVPVFVLVALVSAAGAGILLSALTVAYRDFRYVIGFALQFWMFATPVLYPLDLIPAEWRLAYALNPMAGAVSGFRAAVLGEPIALGTTLVSGVSALGLLALGVLYFQQVERRLADIA